MKKINRSELYRCGFIDTPVLMSEIVKGNGVTFLNTPLWFRGDFYDINLDGEIEIDILASLVKVGRKKSWLIYSNGTHFLTNDLDDLLEKYDKVVNYNPSLGFVYVLKEKGKSRYKIGHTKTLSKRINFFKIQIPFDFKILVAYGCEQYREFEKTVHRFLKQENKHIVGEWFDLENNDLNRLKIYYEHRQELINKPKLILSERMLNNFL